MNNAPLVQLNKISKIYQNGKSALIVLYNLNLTIHQGELIAIVGPSGSGKSTLMNLIGLLDRPSSGTYKLGGETISLDMADRKLAKIRSEKIGFVFQTFNLLPRLSALDNVLLPTVYHRAGKNQMAEAKNLLGKVGLSDRLKHRPTELSGGEKQRVAIARALINLPDIILADEPTGNLDSQTGGEIINLLKQLNDEGKTVIIVTHDEKIANECPRLIRLMDGQIVSDSQKPTVNFSVANDV